MADTFINAIDIVELASTPPNPPSGFRRFYPKSDGKLYQKTSAGVETQLDNVASGGSGYSVTTVNTLTYIAAATSGTNVILIDCSAAGGNVMITIPMALDNTALFVIKKTDASAFTATIIATTSNIDGGANVVLKIKDSSIDIISNNTNWFII